MKFFLSSETQAGGASILMRFHNITQSHLNVLMCKDYGSELTEIAIITILVRKELLADGVFPERRLFKRKTKSADIRLRLDFESFLNSTPEQRNELYCSHIIASIETLRKKVGREFRFDDLIQDVKVILRDPVFQSELLSIRRLP